MDTNARSSGRPWALWTSFGMMAAGLIAVLYVLSGAASKADATESGYARFARGELEDLTVMAAPPALPTRTVRDASGAETNLRAVAGGQVMIVNLWATWCAPCVEEMPTLAAMQRRYQGRLRVATVSIDGEGQRTRAQAQLQRLSNGDLPFLIDTTRRIMFDLQAPGMPVTVIYDRRGREIARIAGGANWDSPEANAFLDAVLAQR